MFAEQRGKMPWIIGIVWRPVQRQTRLNMKSVEFDLVGNSARTADRFVGVGVPSSKIVSCGDKKALIVNLA